MSTSAPQSQALAGDAELVVIEGAAGAGKTTTLAATQTVLGEQGRRMLVVTPTRKAAQVAAREVGTAGSVAWLVHQHGFRWDDDGRWTRAPLSRRPRRSWAMVICCWSMRPGCWTRTPPGRFFTVADEMGARIALVGDRHQLPAVGRGGVLDLAARWVPPQAHVDLDIATGSPTPNTPPSASPCAPAPPPTPSPRQRLGASRTGEPVGERNGERREVWSALWRRDQVRIYPSEAERTQALAELAADAIGSRDRRARQMLMLADTREQAAALNGAIRDRLVAAGRVDDTHTVTTKAGNGSGSGTGSRPAATTATSA